MQLSAFHQDRANRLPEQTQRRVYGGAARAPRRRGGGGGGGIVKNFHWEGEPQRELDTATTTSFRILQLIIRSTAFTTSGVPPSSRTAYSYKYTAPTPTQHGDRTNRMRPGKSMMSLSFPILPEQPGLTVVFRLPLHLWLGMCIRDLGWGPRTRHLVLFQFKFVSLFLWGRNYAASRRIAGVYIYTHTGYLNGSKGKHIRPYSNFTAIYNQVEAQYKQQIGQDRHSKTISQSNNLRVFFLPLMQYGCATQRGTLYITTYVSLGGFLYLNHSIYLYGPRWGPHQTLSKNK